MHQTFLIVFVSFHDPWMPGNKMRRCIWTVKERAIFLFCGLSPPGVGWKGLQLCGQTCGNHQLSAHCVWCKGGCKLCVFNLSYLPCLDGFLLSSLPDTLKRAESLLGLERKCSFLRQHCCVGRVLQPYLKAGGRWGEDALVVAILP